MNEELALIVGDFAQRYISITRGVPTEETEDIVYDENGEIRADIAKEIQYITGKIVEDDPDFFDTYALVENDDERDAMALEKIENLQLEQFKKGGKLQYLIRLKKGGKVKASKCSCGCDLVKTVGKGGKLISKCACGCDGLQKNQLGGELPEESPFQKAMKKIKNNPFKKFK